MTTGTRCVWTPLLAARAHSCSGTIPSLPHPLHPSVTCFLTPPPFSSQPLQHMRPTRSRLSPIPASEDHHPSPGLPVIHHRDSFRNNFSRQSL